MAGKTLKLLLTEQEYRFLLELINRSTLAVGEVNLFLSLAEKLNKVEPVDENGKEE